MGNFKLLLQKNYIIIFYLAIFSHLFLWSAKFFFDVRYLVFLLLIPFIIELFYKKIKLNIIYIPLFILLILSCHLFYANHLNGLSLDKKSLIYCFIVSAFFILIRYNQLLFKKKFDKILLFYFIFFFLFSIFSITHYFFNLENLLPYKRELGYYFYNCTTSFFSDNYFFFNENSHLGMMSVAIVLSGAYIFFSQNNSNIYKYLFITYAVTTFIIYSTTYSISSIICSLFFSVYFLIKRKKKLFLVLLIFGLANYLVFYNFGGCKRKFDQTVDILINKFPKMTEAVYQNRKIEDKYIDSFIEDSESKDIASLIDDLEEKDIGNFNTINSGIEPEITMKLKKIIKETKNSKLKEWLNNLLLFIEEKKALKIEKFEKQKKENIIKMLKAQRKINKRIMTKVDQEKIKDVVTLYESYNLSTNVHFFSALVSFISVQDRPFGWGINQYKYAYDAYFTELEPLMEHKFRLNREDGSNNLFKLFVEFGYFTFLILLIPLVFVFKKNIPDVLKVFSISILVTQSLRGAGYFNGGFLFVLVLMLCAILYSVIYNQDSKNE